MNGRSDDFFRHSPISTDPSRIRSRRKRGAVVDLDVLSGDVSDVVADVTGAVDQNAAHRPLLYHFRLRCRTSCTRTALTIRQLHRYVCRKRRGDRLGS